jgi:hypothetical protein
MEFGDDPLGWVIRSVVDYVTIQATITHNFQIAGCGYRVVLRDPIEMIH